MAASLAVRYCGGGLLQNWRQPKIYSSSSSEPGDRVLAVPKRSTFRRHSQSIRAAEVLHVDLKANSASKGGDDQLGGPEKLDHWMRESVVDIVRNLQAQPLLVRVYEYGENIISNISAEDWEGIEGSWKSGEEPSPEGIILVEELLDQYHHHHHHNHDHHHHHHHENNSNGNSTTKEWGILLLMGDKNWAASYLLKTTNTDSSTHFCLAKVNTFRETVQSQLRNCWLV